MSMDQILDKEALYLQVIRQAYPGLEIHSARLHTGDGQFNDILFIDDDLIFRFPRYEENINDFFREIQLLQGLQGRLSLPIPQPIYFGSEAVSVGSVFMGYRLLPGKPLFREVLHAITNEAIFDSLARQLAEFLHGLHTLSPSVLGLDLPVQNALAEFKKLYSEVREHLFPRMRPDARRSMTNHFETYFDDPSLHNYEPSLIHGDFGGSNILFERDRITGIIDFSFAGLDDPAKDIAAISTYGEEFFRRIRQNYATEESLLARATFYRGTFALQEALHGFYNHDESAFENGMEKYV